MSIPGLFLVVAPNLPKCRVPILSSCRIIYWSLRKGIEALPNHLGWINTPGIRTIAELSGTDSEVVPHLPKCRVLYWGRTEHTDMSGTGVDFVRDLAGVFGTIVPDPTEGFGSSRTSTSGVLRYSPDPTHPCNIRKLYVYHKQLRPSPSATQPPSPSATQPNVLLMGARCLAHAPRRFLLAECWYGPLISVLQKFLPPRAR